jgi:hypothetical protein
MASKLDNSLEANGGILEWADNEIQYAEVPPVVVSYNSAPNPFLASLEMQRNNNKKRSVLILV